MNGSGNFIERGFAVIMAVLLLILIIDIVSPDTQLQGMESYIKYEVYTDEDIDIQVYKRRNVRSANEQEFVIINEEDNHEKILVEYLPQNDQYIHSHLD